MITFLKTHKSASSTVKDVLFRYGLNKDLNFVLPCKGNHLTNPHDSYVSTTEPFKAEWLDEESELLPWHKKLKESRQYDIFNLHAKWNYVAVNSMISRSGHYISQSTLYSSCFLCFFENFRAPGLAQNKIV